MGGMKVCKVCGKEKPEIDFRESNVSGRKYIHTQCRECEAVRERKRGAHKKWVNQLKYKYGLELFEYEAMLREQNNGCAICGKLHSLENKLEVDHCHNPWQIRQLLCPTCNTGIAMLRHNPELCLRAASYLQKHRK